MTKLETVRIDAFPALLFVRIETDDSVTGLGETCLGSRAVEAHLHEAVAPQLLGQDPLRIERHNRAMYEDFIGFSDAGVATRARSAVDIALWDILGKVSGQPLYQLLGGAYRDSIPIYNTCAGPGYGATGPNVDRIGNLSGGRPPGRYEDLEAVYTRPAELAAELLDEGITAMKLWPFDAAALEAEGRHVSNAGLKAAVEPLAKIRDAVGDQMRIMIDLHGLWHMPAVTNVIRAINEFDPYWIEDPVKADDFQLLARIARDCVSPLALGETLATKWSFKRLLDSGAAGVVMFDIGWVGGISEASKIAAMADASGLPVTAHDCTGPVVLSASTHLAISAPNALLQETVRAFHRGWYGDLVTALPEIRNGCITPPRGPGVGTELHPQLFSRSDVHLRSSTA
jgi:galactonate dehydratase